MLFGVNVEGRFIASHPYRDGGAHDHEQGDRPENHHDRAAGAATGCCLGGRPGAGLARAAIAAPKRLSNAPNPKPTQSSLLGENVP